MSLFQEERVRPLQASLDVPDVASLTSDLVQVLGPGNVERRFQRMRRTIAAEKGTYRDRWVLPNQRWWAGLEHLTGLFCGAPPARIHLTEEAVWVLESALTLRTLLPGIPGELRKQFTGRLLSSEGVASPLLELSMAGHFWQAGYAITWLQGSGVVGDRTSEFVASAHDLELEIECKSKTRDAGRRVARPAFYRLADSITELLQERGLYGEVRVELADRMPVGNRWREEVLARLPSREGRGTVAGPGACQISWELFRGGKIVVPESALRDTISALRHEPFAHLSVTGAGGPSGSRGPIVVIARSGKPDRILESIQRELLDAADQFSGTRPGVICMYLPEVESLEAIKDSGVLEGVAHAAFNRRSQRQVAEIRFLADPVIEDTRFGKSTRYPVLAFANPSFEVGPRETSIA